MACHPTQRVNHFSGFEIVGEIDSYSVQKVVGCEGPNNLLSEVLM